MAPSARLRRERLISSRDGLPYFYDVNALSNFVTDAPNLVGLDPTALFVDFLLSKTGQRMIARGPGAAEYPLVKGVPRRPGLRPLSSIKGPKYNLGSLSADLAPAVRLLLEEGFIR